MRRRCSTKYRNRIDGERLMVHSIDLDDGHLVSIDTGVRMISLKYQGKAESVMSPECEVGIARDRDQSKSREESGKLRAIMEGC
jgi:hypothetical protein